MTDEPGALNLQYPRRPRCTLCQQHPSLLSQVHAAMWDVPAAATEVTSAMRTRAFSADAERILASRGVKLTRQSIANHASHVEDTAIIRTYESGNHTGERKVFASDYRSVVDTTSRLAMKAADRLDAKMDSGDLDDRALVSVLSAGVRAREGQQRLEQKDRQHGDQMKALLLFGSGMLGALPDGEADEAPVAVRVLHAELDAERQSYYIAAGHSEGGDEVPEADEA